MKLKPGMTANVSVIIAQKDGVVRVSNAALRARIPSELLPKPAENVAPKKTGAPESAAMTDQERFAIYRSARTEAGIQRGTPPTPDQLEKAKKLALDKGLDAEFIARMSQFTGGGGQGGGGFGRRGGNGGTGERGATNPVVTRTLYKLAGAGSKQIEPAVVRLGISDGINTEVIDGLAENDIVITAVTIPGAPATGAGAQNPFQQGRGFGPPGFGGGRGR
jgi:HlyD family secretion protein